jgi:hypothetical protein
MHATQIRTTSPLYIAQLRLNESAVGGQTLFKLEWDRRERTMAGLRCTVQLLVAQRVSLVRDDIA